MQRHVGCDDAIAGQLFAEKRCSCGRIPPANRVVQIRSPAAAVDEKLCGPRRLLRVEGIDARRKGSHARLLDPLPEAATPRDKRVMHIDHRAVKEADRQPGRAKATAQEISRAHVRKRYT